MSKRFFLFLIIFTAVLSILGFWYWKRNVYSKEAVRLELLGPDRPAAFEEVEYIVKYKNNGNVALEDIRLIFEYPKYVLLPAGEQKRKVISGETLYPGQERSFSFRGRLVGGAGQALEARASLNYRPKNLKAKYESQTTHTAIISSVPLTVGIDLPSRIESTRQFAFFVNYFSQSDYPLTNLRLLMEYPAGFRFAEARPKGLDVAEWEVGLLNKAEGGRVEVRGFVEGEEGEQKSFKAKLGVWIEEDFILLKEETRALAIARPSLYIMQNINGAQNYIASPGDLLHYEIYFRNVGESFFENLFLAVRLEGDVYDFASLRVGDGRFQQGDNSVLWDWQAVPQLRFLGPGEEGKIEFWVSLRDAARLPVSAKNLVAKNTVILSSARQTFETKIRGGLQVTQSVYFQDAIFDNRGSMPPKAGETTTYTVLWRAQALRSDTDNVKVKARLPEQVRLTAKVFPEDTKLTFDLQSKELVWEIGKIEAGIVQDASPSVAFQIGLTPEAKDIGNVVPLIGDARISGIDLWTGSELEGIAPGRDTSLPDDPTISEGQGVVRGY